MAFRASVSKPKLSLNLNMNVQSTRPSLSLKTPTAAVCPRTPISPSPISPTARNTRINRKGYSTSATYQQVPSYAYANNSGCKSVLKKSASTGTTSKRCQIEAEPTVYCVTPIEAGEEYYGGYVKMSRDERRWGLRS